jgi:hypothetical protein
LPSVTRSRAPETSLAWSDASAHRPMPSRPAHGRTALCCRSSTTVPSGIAEGIHGVHSDHGATELALMLHQSADRPLAEVPGEASLVVSANGHGSACLRSRTRRVRLRVQSRVYRVHRETTPAGQRLCGRRRLPPPVRVSRSPLVSRAAGSRLLSLCPPWSVHGGSSASWPDGCFCWRIGISGLSFRPGWQVALPPASPRALMRSRIADVDVHLAVSSALRTLGALDAAAPATTRAHAFCGLWRAGRRFVAGTAGLRSR